MSVILDNMRKYLVDVEDGGGHWKFLRKEALTFSLDNEGNENAEELSSLAKSRTNASYSQG